MSALLSVAYIVVAAAGAGRWLAPRMPQSLRPAERMALQVLGGLGILGLALFLIGNIRLSPAIIGCTLAAPAAYGVWTLRLHARLNRPALGVLCAAAILVVVLISSFDVPIGTSDDISYHLLGPAVWLRDGYVHTRPDNFAISFPSTVEMLFAAATGISNQRAPGLLTFAFAVILLAQICGFAKRLGASDRVAGLAVLLGAAMPALMDNVGSAFVDVPLACFALAALRIVLDRAKPAHVAAAALFIGAAMGTKYTGIFVLFATVAILLLPAVDRPLRRRFADAALLALVSGAFGGAWYLRNWIVLGSPIYPPPPGLARWFPVRGMYAGALAAYQQYLLHSAGGQFGRGPLALLALPFRLTYNFPAFWGWQGGLGIAPLALIPLAVPALRRNRAALYCLAWALILTLCWFATAQISRYLMPVLALLPVFSAMGAAETLRWPAATRALTWAILLVSVLHGSYMVAAQHWVRVRDVLSPAYAAATRAANPYASAYDYLNGHSEVRGVLILDRFVKPYYLQKPYLMIRGEYGEQPVDGVSDIGTALPRLGELGATHVLDVRHPDADFAVSPDSRLKLVFAAADARIFEVVAEPRAIASGALR